MAAGSTLPISALPLLPAAESSTLAAWNATRVDHPRHPLFPRLFEEQVQRGPHATAISHEGARCSYAELDSHANAVARRLRELGIGAGRLAAVCMSRSPLVLVSLLATLKSGGGYVPLDPDFPTARLNYMLADSGATVLLTAGGVPPGLEVPEGIVILDVTPIALAHADAAAPAAELGNFHRKPGPADTAYVIYTSGSTGRPKGVSVSHGALLNFLLFHAGPARTRCDRRAGRGHHHLLRHRGARALSAVDGRSAYRTGIAQDGHRRRGSGGPAEKKWRNAVAGDSGELAHVARDFVVAGRGFSRLERR